MSISDTPNDSEGIEAALCSRNTEPKPIEEIVREVQSMNICTSLALAHTVLKAVNEHHQANHAMRAAIDAYCQAEGVVMVPREPTDEMVESAKAATVCQGIYPVSASLTRIIYRAMVAQFEGDRDE